MCPGAGGPGGVVRRPGHEPRNPAPAGGGHDSTVHRFDSDNKLPIDESTALSRLRTSVERPRHAAPTERNGATDGMCPSGSGRAAFRRAGNKTKSPFDLYRRTAAIRSPSPGCRPREETPGTEERPGTPTALNPSEIEPGDFGRPGVSMVLMMSIVPLGGGIGPGRRGEAAGRRGDGAVTVVAVAVPGAGLSFDGVSPARRSANQSFCRSRVARSSVTTVAAATSVRMAARIGSGRVGHAAMRAARSASGVPASLLSSLHPALHPESALGATALCGFVLRRGVCGFWFSLSWFESRPGNSKPSDATRCKRAPGCLFFRRSPFSRDFDKADPCSCNDAD